MNDIDVLRKLRIGNGYDVHALVKGRKLILGGVEIDHSKGLLGHSDADVLVHAIIDAIVGALCLGDIGKLFPDNDPKYKGISSILLLEQVHIHIKDMGYEIINIDSVIMVERPKMAPHINFMRAKIAETLSIAVDRVSVKATTTEKLGFVGREEGIASSATILMYKK
ncbi:MAG: 2-C-methyl-D-erythritol 2,4-cyclodiphosphate synthase [Acidaminobacteraceae bacterium]